MLAAQWRRGHTSHRTERLCAQARFNPQPWAPQMGQNFTGNNGAAAIDVATMHVWCAAAPAGRGQLVGWRLRVTVLSMQAEQLGAHL